MSRNCFSSIRWLSHLRNYEKAGIPVGAGTANSTTWDLEQMHSLLGFLNNPHSTLKNVVHVVGTKGKGSVAAMLNSVLEDAGYRVGRYTSPHLVCEGERISIGELSELRVVRVVVFCRGNPRNKPATCAGGKPMSLEALDRLIDTNKPLIECALEARPDTSYFEAVTALAIRHFADSEIDWAIMEAGLGGVSDATNVFKAHQVRATVITTLEEEHLDALGGSLQSIAVAKAGIVHPGTLVVIGSQPRTDAVSALQAALKTIPGVRPVWVSQNALVDQGLQIEGTDGTKQRAAASSVLVPSLGASPLHLSMLGSHNVLNAGTTATAVAEMVSEGSVGVSQEALRTGLERAQLLGRFDIRWRSSPGHWICLDTAHTVASCEAMVNAALRIFPKSSSRALIVGLAADKNMEGIVRSLAILQPSLVLCVAPDSCGLGARGQPAEEVSSAFHRALGCDGDPSDAEKLSADYSDCKMPSVHTVSSMDEALRKVEMWAQGSHVAVSLDGDDEVPDESAKNDRAPLVCVTGSNYVVGAAIKSLQEM